MAEQDPEGALAALWQENLPERKFAQAYQSIADLVDTDVIRGAIQSLPEEQQAEAMDLMNMPAATEILPMEAPAMEPLDGILADPQVSPEAMAYGDGEGGGVTNITNAQTINAEIVIDGSGDPQATAEAVGDYLRDEARNASASADTGVKR